MRAPVGVSVVLALLSDRQNGLLHVLTSLFKVHCEVQLLLTSDQRVEQGLRFLHNHVQPRSGLDSRAGGRGPKHLKFE